MHTRGLLGVAVIGTGRMGSDHVRRIDEVISGARVVAVADPDVERARALAEGVADCTAHADHEAALAADGVDAVLIASPGPAHEPALLTAFERDLPVLCEKPLAQDAEAGLRIMEAELRQGRRRVQLGFMRRFDREYVQLERLLTAGELGRPLLVHCRHRNASVPPYFTEAMMITDSVSHEVDCARWLLRQEITAVSVFRPAPNSHAPAGLGDPQLVILETDGGVVVDVEISVSSGLGYQVQTEAVCERGTARIGEAHGLMTNTAAGWGGSIAPDYVERFEEAYDREVQQWVDATRQGTVQGPSVWDGYAVSAVCEAGVAAQSTGRRTPVELVERPSLYR